MAETNLGRVAIVPRGTYSASIQYVYLDLVFSDGNTYVAISDPPVGTSPTNATYWQLVATGGSPKGVYASLAALQAAFPTGTTGIYVTSDNGHWYFWSGSAWSDGGAYQAALSVVQTTGTSTTDVMSQKAVTDNLAALKSITETPTDEIRPNITINEVSAVNPFTAYKGNQLCKWNPSTTSLTSIDIKSGTIDDITLLFVKINSDLSYNALHTHTFSASIGINNVLLSAVDFDFQGIAFDVYVLAKGTKENTILYSGIEGNMIVSIPLGSAVVVYNEGYSIGIRLNVTTYSELKNKINEIGVRLNNIEAVIPNFDLAKELKYKNHIIIPEGTWVVEETINVPSGVTIEGVSKKSILQAGATCTKVLSLIGVNDITLSNFKIKGTAADILVTATDKVNSLSDVVFLNGVGNNMGIYLETTKAISVKNLEISNFDGYGIKAMVLGESYSKGCVFDTICINNCYLGAMFLNSAEYSFLTNASINNCLIGFHITSGNMLLSSISSTGNRVNAFIGTGSNSGHGSMVGCLYNHAQLYGLVVYSELTGYTISGCNIIDAPILISNSRGIVINGGILNTLITITGGGSEKANSITNNVFYKSIGGDTPITITDNTKTVLKNNYFMDGSDAAAINN